MRPTRTIRSIAAALALGTGLGALALAAPPAHAADPVPTEGEPCGPGGGVTVVVDFQELGGAVEIACAPGEQASGFAALEAAGFTTNDDGGAPAGALCQIDGIPADGYPYCWYEGYWSYWKADGGDPWGFAPTGPSAGPIAVGAIEGWSWDGPGNGTAGAPRVDTADLASPPADCAATVQVPTFDIVDDDEDLPVHLADGYPTEVAVVAAGTEPGAEDWSTAEVVDLSGRSGPTRILARRLGGECPDAPTFDTTTDVRAAYAPRWNGTGDGSPSPAVDKADERIVAFATGHVGYAPGSGVNDGFKTPDNALGPIDGSIVVLGDRGEITLTFDRPIADGDGHDLAVYENGFAYGEEDYVELGYVEVSSNGTDFVRFDSASRRVDPVGSFVAMDVAELGGLAGKDLAGKGTPFDLALLANHDEVRDGTVDLGAITHVRIRDIKGDGGDLDSFGRPIYDPDPVSGSAGFDLAGVAVLNQQPRSADEAWVHAAITDFLGRAPTDAEVADLTGRLAGGARRADLARELSTSTEWVERIVTRFYLDTLGREPDPSGLAHWVNQIRTGRRTVAQVAGSFYASSEYYREIGGGTDATWVADLYRKLLEREPEAAGQAYWERQVVARGRTSVATRIYGSPESRRARVERLYQDLLGRAADPGGLTYWSGRIATEGDLALAVHLASSGEYLRRAEVRFG
ncbi:MAG: DUF4214 domain-containing protein [Acidimicrobiales bacterium]|nr:DUF4214 domain-containing protein [Acidimicrobiales bacterium]